jgi:polyhydroxyalkanoate synthesis regulator phasin
VARTAKTAPKPPPSRAEAVRAAVDQAFQATAGRAEVTGRRAQEIADELAGAVTRLRDVLEDARPVTTTDLDGLRAEVAAVQAGVAGLGERVAALEAAAAAPAKPVKQAGSRPVAPQRKPAAKKPAGRASAASRVPAARAAARRQADQRSS